jgi:hypothetical protein
MAHNTVELYHQNIAICSHSVSTWLAGFLTMDSDDFPTYNGLVLQWMDSDNAKLEMSFK